MYRLKALEGAANDPPFYTGPSCESSMQITIRALLAKSIGTIAKEPGAAFLSEEATNVARARNVLMGMESRALPRDYTLGHLDRFDVSDTTCFDVAGASGLCSWTAHKLCTRCKALGVLFSTITTPPFSSIRNSDFNVALFTTSCISDRPLTGTMPRLPAEVLDMIVDWAVMDMERTRNGAAVAALMHTSSWLRLRAVEGLPPLKLYECENLAHNPEYKVYLPRELVSWVGEILHFHVQDFSLKKHKLKQPAELESRELLIDTTGTEVEAISFEMFLRSHSPTSLDSLESEPSGALGPQATIERPFNVERQEPTYVSVKYVCQALLRQLEELNLATNDRARVLSPFFRACRYDVWDIASYSPIIHIRALFYFNTDERWHNAPVPKIAMHEAFERSFKFSTSMLSSVPPDLEYDSGVAEQNANFWT